HQERDSRWSCTSTPRAAALETRRVTRASPCRRETCEHAFESPLVRAHKLSKLCGNSGASRGQASRRVFGDSASPNLPLVSAPHNQIGFAMRVYRAVLSVAGVLVAIPATVLGVDTFVRWKPAPDRAVVQRVDASKDLDAYLRGREDSVVDVKPAARKGIIWRDAVHKTKTPLALIYLHGFSATRAEFSPVVEHLSDSLGANVFLTRLAAH